MKFYLDLAEQAVAAYLLSAIGLLLADGADVTHVSVLRTVAVAALPAALTVAKGGLARLVGDRDSANFLT